MLTDDGWLNLTPEALEDMLRKKSGSNNTDKSTAGKDTFDLSKVADSMKVFVEKMSGVEGAEIPAYVKGEGWGGGIGVELSVAKQLCRSSILLLLEWHQIQFSAHLTFSWLVKIIL